MSFGSLLGNEQLKQNLATSLRRGRVSHFYLISGPQGSGKHTLARLLAAAMVCRGEQKPCLSCPDCRKVMADTHPDFITVDDPEKKTVSVDLIRDARADIYIQPNEADRKVYLFPRAQDMGLPGQNALLKVLEEPPSYGVFLLLTDNPEKLLPTVRSRCTELQLRSLPEDLLRRELQKEFPQADMDAVEAAMARSGGYLGQARAILENGAALPQQTEDFIRAYAARDALALMKVLSPMEKWKRDALIEVLSGWLELLENALVCRAGMKAASPGARQIGAARSSPEIMGAVDELKKAITYAQGNVSPAAICGYLEWALR